MNWEKLKPKNYFTEPVEYIYAGDIFDTKEYDKLYENQNNLDHQIWQEFDKKYKTGFEFKEDIQDIDFKKEIIALWFFRERADTNHPPTLDLKGKLIAYSHNAFLLTKFKNIKIKEAKRKYIRRPLVQIDMSKKQYDELVEKLK
jgi:hypothetical protein|tara:strand:+ start:81 stop:512 length:432 start_codon:yes stop_codon:yes gene_type:complete